jgi:hypothetical protein
VLDGRARDIIGVMPDWFRFLDRPATMILPLRFDRTQTRLGNQSCVNTSSSLIFIREVDTPSVSYGPFAILQRCPRGLGRTSNEHRRAVFSQVIDVQEARVHTRHDDTQPALPFDRRSVPKIFAVDREPLGAEFSDGSKQAIDFSPVRPGELYGSLYLHLDDDRDALVGLAS